MSLDRVPQWPTMGVEEREIQYSPSSMLDGPLGPYLDDYAQRSAEAVSEVMLNHRAAVATLLYGDGPSNTVRLAAHVTADEPYPIHIFIHGGYWQELSHEESFFLAAPCLARSEAFAAVDYTLAPRASLDEIVDGCVAAVQMVRRSATNGLWPADPDRITISGSSAGAHLAAMTAARLPLAERPAALVLVSGIYDLEPLVATSINDAVGLDITAAHRNSPSRADLTDFPPTVMAWGENEPDEFKRQSRMFADLIRAAGGSVAEIEVAGRNHFDVVFDIVPTLTDLIPD